MFSVSFGLVGSINCFFGKNPVRTISSIPETECPGYSKSCFRKIDGESFFVRLVVGIWIPNYDVQNIISIICKSCVFLPAAGYCTPKCWSKSIKKLQMLEYHRKKEKKLVFSAWESTPKHWLMVGWCAPPSGQKAGQNQSEICKMLECLWNSINFVGIS